MALALLKKAQTKRKMSILMPFLATLVEGSSLWNLHKELISVWGFLLTHVLVVSSVLLWTLHCYRNSKDLRMPLLLSITTIVLGPIGAAGSLLTSVEYRLFTKSKVNFEEWYREFVTINQGTGKKLAYESLVKEVQKGTLGEETIVPFTDTLSRGSEKEKHFILTKIAQYLSPKFLPVLREGINNKDNSIKVLSASIIERLESSYLKKILKKSKNEDNPEQQLQNAQIYADYVNSGLLDEVAIKKEAEKAIQQLQVYLLDYPDSEDACIEVGRLLLICEKEKEAHAWLKECIEEKNMSSESLLKEYLQILHKEKAFKEIYNLAIKWKNSGKLTDEFREILQLWN